MSRRLLVSLVALSVVIGASLGQAARRDIAAVPLVVPTAELIVFEVERCIYCDLFRRDVLPGYKSSLSHAKAPMRFVDAGKMQAVPAGLDGPVTIVPTVVLLRDGREIGRIAGYTGPEMFYQMIGHLLDRMGE